MVYVNKGFWWRQTLSLAAVILVAIYGLWELWSATYGSADYHSPFGEIMGLGDDRYVFGFIFLGGGLYGIWQLINDAADTVSTFEVDEATGASVVSLWRPFWTEKLTIELSRIRDWRFHVKVGKRNARTFFVFADHPGYPRPLQFDLRNASVEGLRTVAPEAFAEYEAATKPPTGPAGKS
jgi:hypothetical protein